MRRALLHASLLILLLYLPSGASAQSSRPLTSLPLDAMQAFRPVADNWQIVGDVLSDRHTRWSLDAQPGVGILANRPTEQARANLFTTWEHGDIELELDVMMPQGSNSGIYLQGRYEVQLLDSWGVETPTFSDCGGIYQRWDASRPNGREGFAGHPPRMNASRAPGLWQHFRILFRAPRFDEAGTKTTNARFVRVEHNGVVVHENVEVTGPTRAAAFDDEQPTGPIMFQGDHGPVAFRNIRYKRFATERVRLTDLRYRIREDRFEQLPTLAGSLPEHPLDALTGQVGANPDTFAVAFDGTMMIPTAGAYWFTLSLDWITGDPHFRDQQIGGGRLTIEGKTALLHDGTQQRATGAITLSAGRHPFRLAYFKNRPWNAPSMALHVEGPDTPLHALHAPASVERPTPIGAITATPTQAPLIVRSFMTHLGRKRTHVASVGDPGGIHYSMDLGQAALLHVWKGPFLDATAMWHSRGHDQLASPQGSVLTLPGAPSLALLDDAEAPWPDSVNQAASYRFHGYDLDDAGYPTFRYNLGGVAIEDQLLPNEDARYLTRTLVLRAEDAPASLWLRVATGADIRRLAPRVYAVDQQTYYIELEQNGGAEPMLRTTAQGQELLLPIRFTDAELLVAYTMIW